MANQYLVSIRSGFARDQALRFLHLQYWGILEVRQATTFGQREMLRLCLPINLPGALCGGSQEPEGE